MTWQNRSKQIQQFENQTLAAIFHPVPDALFRPLNDVGVSGQEKSFNRSNRCA